jgi:hypothetical protein
MTHTCGCPADRRIVDQDAHDAFHALVIEQGGPAGVVNAKTCELECGHHMTATGKDLYGSIRCCWCPPVKRGTFEPVQGW